MSSRPHPSLFEATRSALLLPRSAADRTPIRVDHADFCKSKLDKNFWILRELGRELILVDLGVGLPDFSRCAEGTPHESFD
jgi:hypothetical protein